MIALTIIHNDKAYSALLNEQHIQSIVWSPDMSGVHITMQSGELFITSHTMDQIIALAGWIIK